MERFFLTNIESVLLWYFMSQLFEELKELHKLLFKSKTKFEDTKLILTQHSDH